MKINANMRQAVMCCMAVVALARCAIGAEDAKKAADDASFRSDFKVDERNLVSTGRNKFFILEPGFQLILEGKEKGKNLRLEITVLAETKKIGSVETRVVEEYETTDGKQTEKSRNYFAIDKTTQDVYYFGEDVGGKWLSGEDGAKFGLMMPGTVKVGDKYCQEIAKKAQDRALNVSVSETVTTPAGTFKDCLKTEETTPLEPDEKEYKYYAPEIGMVKYGEMVLVKYGTVK